MDIKATPYSNLKVFTHFDKLKSIKDGTRTAPVYIRLKPTNVCNHHCYYCSYADSDLALRDDVNPKDSIPWPKMQEIIDDMGSMGVKGVTLSGGGEPLVYDHIVETMESLLEKGIDLSIITNGQLLSGEAAKTLCRAKWVRISFDSASGEVYSKIRGIPVGSFDKVCENIGNFARIKPKECELGINFVINHENAHQVYEVAKLVRDLGVNHIKYTTRITKDLDNYHQPFKADAVEQIHRAKSELTREGFIVINKYEEDFEFSTVFKRVYSKCYAKEFLTIIAADCKVYFCHDKAYVKSGVVGDLKERSFKELWFSPEVYERYRNFNAQEECCHHCVYDDRNMMLNSFFSLDDNHINFI